MKFSLEILWTLTFENQSPAEIYTLDKYILYTKETVEVSAIMILAEFFIPIIQKLLKQTHFLIKGSKEKSWIIWPLSENSDGLLSPRIYMCLFFSPKSSRNGLGSRIAPRSFYSQFYRPINTIPGQTIYLTCVENLVMLLSM